MASFGIRSVSTKTGVWVSVAALTLGAGVMPGAQADEISDLIASMDEVSQQVNAKNEEVKALEDDVAQREGELAAINEEVAAAKEGVAQARAAADSYREKVNELAVAKYRGAQEDAAIKTLSVGDPQTAIDRSAYLAALTRNSEATIKGLHDAIATAGEREGAAQRASAEATFQQSQLQRQLDTLKAEQAELTSQSEEIIARVDALSAEERLAWENKYGPLAVNLAGVTGSESGMAAVNAALSKLGSAYSWGASGPDLFDCSGLMYWAYQQQGKTVPRTSQAQVAGGTPVSRADLQPGDIVGFYPGATHVGMYIGNGQVVHAADYGIPVQVVSVDSMPWAGAARY